MTVWTNSCIHSYQIIPILVDEELQVVSVFVVEQLKAGMPAMKKQRIFTVF